MTQEYIGVDLHKAFFQACAMSPTGERTWEGRFPRTADGVARFIARGVARRRRWRSKRVGRRGRSSTRCEPTGARVCVVDPRKTKLKAGFAAKTDRLDARRLADALRRESVVSIYIPPPAIRELREVCRGRHQLVRLRTRVAQMIRALLLRCDAGEPPGTRLYAPRALAWLAAAQLPPDADRTLRRLERLYQAIHVDAQAADAEVRRRAAADPIAVALTELVGIGPVMALTHPRGDRRHRPVHARGRAGVLCRPGAARRQQRGSRLPRPHYPRRLAVAALGAGRNGAPRDQTAGCGGPVGAPPGGAEGTPQGPRRAGARAVRPGRARPGRHV